MYKLPECSVSSPEEYKLIHSTVGPEEFIKILEDVVKPRLDAGEYASLDCEGSNLNPHALSYDLTGTGIAIANNDREGYSWYCDHKYPHSLITGSLLSRYRKFLDNYYEKLVVFNCSYELKAFWSTVGKPYYFTDCRALVSAAGRFGSLKNNAKELINAPDWEDDNSDAVGAFTDVSKLLNKRYYEVCITARQSRIDNEEAGVQFTPSEIIPNYEQVKEDLDYKSVVEAVNKHDVSDLSRDQKLLVKAATIGVTEDEIMHSMMYDISSGWGGVPTRFLSPYCGADCFYTIQLFNLLNTDPVIRKAYPSLQDEIMVGGVMESFGINWDDTVAARLESAYLKDMSDSLRYLAPKMDHGLDDESDPHNWKRDLLDKIENSTLPFDYEIRNTKGGYKYEHDVIGMIPTSAQQSKWGQWLFDIDEHMNEVVLLPPTKYIIALQDEIKSIKEETEELVIQYGDYDKLSEEDKLAHDKIIVSSNRRINNREAKLESIKTHVDKDWYGKAITSEVFETLTPPLVVKYTNRKGSEAYIDTIKVTISNNQDYVQCVKDHFFNPGSSSEINKEKFWGLYLTPRMMSANMLFNIIKYIESVNLLDYFSEGSDTDLETGEVHKTPPKPRKVLMPDGTIKVYKEPIIDRMDLQGTMKRLVEFSREITPSSSISYSMIGSSKAITHNMSKEERDQHEERIKTFSLQNRFSSVISDIMSQIRGWTGKGCGFDTDAIEYQYKIHHELFGLDVNDQSTWSDEYRALHNFRIYKKCNKNLTTYINGNSLGRGSVILANKSPADRYLPLRYSGDLVNRSEVKVSQAVSPTRSTMDYWSASENTDLIQEILSDHRLVLETDFFTIGTETRRWRSRNHVVPANSELRRCYQPHFAGWLRVHEDYSGAELCVVAAITNCKAMLDAFMTGGDVHMNTSVGVFQKPASQITDMERRYCKIITFRLLYGSTVEGLAVELMISLDRAQKMVDGFMETYPELESYIEWSRAHARKYGWVPTITGAPVNLDKYCLEIDQRSINYRIQASSTNLAGSGIGRMWKKYYEMNMPWMPESFTHDSIDASVHPMYYHIHTFMQKRIAEDDNVAAWNAPMRMDLEVGINGYDICGIKQLSRDIYSGLDPSNPIILNMHGTEISVNGLLDSLRPYFNVEVIENKRKVGIYDNDLWVPKRSYSTTFGQAVTSLDVDLVMTYKTDVPEFKELMQVIADPYVADTHQVLLNSFRHWKTKAGTPYGVAS